MIHSVSSIKSLGSTMTILQFPPENVVAIGSNKNESTPTNPTSQSNTKQIKFYVGDMDVICGRGKAGFNHPGNIRFRQAVMQAMEDYQHAEDRVGKPIIVRAIISNTHSNGGCFLRRDLKHPAPGDKSAWIELNFQEQKDKVRHALRDAIAEMKVKKLKAAVKEQESRSSSTDPLHGSNTSQTVNELSPKGEPSSAFSSVAAFPSQPALHELLRRYDEAKSVFASTNGPSGSLGNSGTEAPMTNTVMDDDSTRSTGISNTLVLQLAAQLRVVQSNNRNNMNQSIVLQLYNQIQKELQIQNAQNCIRTVNALRMAIQHDDNRKMQKFLANVQNLTVPSRNNFVSGLM